MKKITILIISLLITFFGISALQPVFADDDVDPALRELYEGMAAEEAAASEAAAVRAEAAEEAAETIMRDLERDLAEDEAAREADEAAREADEAAGERVREFEEAIRAREIEEAAREGERTLQENREELLQGNDRGTTTVREGEGIIRYEDTPSTEPLNENPPAPDAELAPDADDPNKLSETYFKVNEYLALPDGKQPTQYFADAKYSPIVSFIIRIIDFATRIIGSIAIILLIITGFMFMFAQGNQQQLDEAKDMLKYTIIGLVVTFLSYIIVIFVQSIFTPI